MFAKLKTIALTAILVGAILLIFKIEETFYLYNAPSILIIAGFIFLVISLISQLATNKEQSLLCRVGLHKYERIGRDSEIPAMFIYKCERCGKRKKAISVT
ncbi:hypothetical protein [Planococcus halocryophilus]|uniref:hypothetical protein n=1 Tax=Planococcus halocryophilus TaxID=1215089 RepID=UPI001F0DD86D|nr:hypothetical protein [Planococcus halocryophilus]MCH4827580.1 hypothetical protein [Planococcus halocryophilus]